MEAAMKKRGQGIGEIKCKKYLIRYPKASQNGIKTL